MVGYSAGSDKPWLVMVGYRMVTLLQRRRRLSRAQDASAAACLSSASQRCATCAPAAEAATAEKDWAAAATVAAGSAAAAEAAHTWPVGRPSKHPSAARSLGAASCPSPWSTKAGCRPRPVAARCRKQLLRRPWPQPPLQRQPPASQHARQQPCLPARTAAPPKPPPCVRRSLHTACCRTSSKRTHCPGPEGAAE
mgnify:CR=1 FL=1